MPEKLSTRDPEKYAAIQEEIMSHRQIRDIAARHNVAPSTVSLVKSELKEAGKLPSKQDVVKELVDRATILAGESLVEALESGKLTPKEISISFGILIDKMQLLSGNPTDIKASITATVSPEELREKIVKATKKQVHQ